LVSKSKDIILSDICPFKKTPSHQTVIKIYITDTYYDINNDKWNFKNFIVIRSKKVPGELDPYPVDGSFQGEYIAAKDKVKNRSRRLTDSRGFDWFKYDLRDAMKFYDMKW